MRSLLRQAVTPGRAGDPQAVGADARGTTVGPPRPRPSAAGPAAEERRPDPAASRFRRIAPVGAAAVAAVSLVGCGVTEAVYTQIHVLNRTSTPVEVRAPSADRFIAPACGEGYRVNFDAGEAAVLGPDGSQLAVIAGTVPEGRLVLQRLWVVLTPDTLRLYPEATAAPTDLPACDGPARPITSPTATPPRDTSGTPPPVAPAGSMAPSG